MDFFEAQDSARKKTWLLGWLFAAAVLSLVVFTNLLLVLAYMWAQQASGIMMSPGDIIASQDWTTWAWVSFGVLGLVATASLYKYFSIRGGGRTIAEALGGRLIPTNTSDPQQRQLLNVVEEMAIAAGISVPPVYLVPEQSINAFAAGFTADDAVIGINQGTLDLLNRSELQGVVAHEFSHILHGDTGINLRLIAALHGILFLGMIGYGLLRGGQLSGRREGLPFAAIGIGLVIIGYGGSFFGNIIKAAVSRQREYLADASAVQYTREPEGIADALKKIGGHLPGSYMENEAAEEASHMFFGAAAPKFAARLFATHPALPDRIKAIEPNWNGEFLTTATLRPDFRTSQATASASELATGFAGAGLAQDVVDHIGQPTAQDVELAQTRVSSLEDTLATVAHNPYDARALAYCLLLDKTEPTRARQLDFIVEHADPQVSLSVNKLMSRTDGLTNTQRFTLMEMAVPALKQLSRGQYQRFQNNATQLIASDNRVDIFEWSLHRLLVKSLYAHFNGPQRTHGRIKHVQKLPAECAQLLSILANHADGDYEQQQSAFEAGMRELGISRPFAPQQFDYTQLNLCLKRLRRLRPLAKPALLKACVTAASHDNVINDDEYSLLQGVAAALDCPLPPSASTPVTSS